MQKKQCFKCGETKRISEFYVHPQMADGHLNKCKECTKRDVAEHRRGKGRERILAYDRARAKTPERKDVSRRVKQEYYRKYPERRVTAMAVQRAKRGGELVPPERCSECGRKGNIHGHHKDYSKPLDIEWLCEHCHRAIRHVTAYPELARGE